jgi:hypothetical protein
MNELTAIKKAYAALNNNFNSLQKLYTELTKEKFIPFNPLVLGFQYDKEKNEFTLIDEKSYKTVWVLKCVDNTDYWTIKNNTPINHIAFVLQIPSQSFGKELLENLKLIPKNYKSMVGA